MTEASLPDPAVTREVSPVGASEVKQELPLKSNEGFFSRVWQKFKRPGGGRSENNGERLINKPEPKLNTPEGDEYFVKQGREVVDSLVRDGFDGPTVQSALNGNMKDIQLLKMQLDEKRVGGVLGGSSAMFQLEKGLEGIQNKIKRENEKLDQKTENKVDKNNKELTPEVQARDAIDSLIKDGFDRNTVLSALKGDVANINLLKAQLNEKKVGGVLGGSSAMVQLEKGLDYVLKKADDKKIDKYSDSKEWQDKAKSEAMEAWRIYLSTRGSELSKAEQAVGRLLRGGDLDESSMAAIQKAKGEGSLTLPSVVDYQIDLQMKILQPETDRAVVGSADLKPESDTELEEALENLKINPEVGGGDEFKKKMEAFDTEFQALMEILNQAKDNDEEKDIIIQLANELFRKIIDYQEILQEKIKLLRGSGVDIGSDFSEVAAD